MRQYKEFNLYINYNLFEESESKAFVQKEMRDYDNELAKNPRLQAEIQKERAEAIRKYGGYNDYRRQYAEHAAQTQATYDQTFREEIAVEKQPSATAIKFEESVVRKLDIIYGTEIGRCIMAFINKQKKVWIIPAIENGQPTTFWGETSHDELNAKYGGGIRIKFYPWESGMPKNSYYDTDDDILFHELVHAYRDSHQRYGEQSRENNLDNLNNFTNEEEFIALCLQNMYRSARGNNRLYKAYGGNIYGTQSEVQDYLFSRSSLVRSLDKAQQHDPFIKLVKNWKFPRFNPWRDFESLSKSFYSRDPFLSSKRLPPLPF